MEVKEIPQDNSSTYDGFRRVVYATDNGHYVAGITSGWQVEEFVTKQAVADLDQRTREAYQAVQSGQYSPLHYYMYRFRYELFDLAQEAGFFMWQVKRHLKPEVFFRLPEKKLQRYAHAFGLSVEEVKKLPEYHQDKKTPADD